MDNGYSQLQQDVTNAHRDIIRMLGDMFQDYGLLTPELRKYMDTVHSIYIREGEQAIEELRDSIRIKSLRGLSDN